MTMKIQRFGMVAVVMALGSVGAASAVTWQQTGACAFSGTGTENVDRGFYITSYPGNNLSKIQLAYTASNGAGGIWSITLTARRTRYDGPVIGSPQTLTVNVPEKSTGKEMFAVFDFAGAPVTAGDTITFTQTAQKFSGPLGDLFYDVPTTTCQRVVETQGTTPPLDTPRNKAVGFLLFEHVVTGQCIPSDTVMCVDDVEGDRRYKVTASFHTSQDDGVAGPGESIPTSNLGVVHGGLLWFFTPDNPEVLIKLVNGCAISNHHWVFLSPATNVGFTITVLDTVTGQTVSYDNADLHAADPVQDTGTLNCP
jgi:hypothetical protein